MWRLPSSREDVREQARGGMFPEAAPSSAVEGLRPGPLVGMLVFPREVHVPLLELP